MMARTVVASGPGLPQTADQRVRWLPVYNESGETIPPFACMEVGAGSTGKDGTTIFHVYKPGVDPGFDGCFRPLKHLAVYMFNGPKPIPKEREGVGTMDYPCKALILSDDIPLSSQGFNAFLKPTGESWLLTDGGADFEFSFICRDVTAPVGDTTKPVTTCWISRGKFGPSHGAQFLSPNTSPVAAGAVIDTTLDEDLVTSVHGADARYGLKSHQYGLLCQRESIYLIGFCGTIDGLNITPAVPSGSVLRVGFAIQDDDQAYAELGTSTGYFGMRRHYRDTDQYGYSLEIGSENVSFQGRMELSEGDLVQAYNSGATAFNLTHGYLWGMSLGESRHVAFS